jgi:hypothetical protein
VIRFLSVLAASALFAGSAEAGITETATPLGKYTLIETVSVLEPGDPHIMHVNQNWTKLRLSFVSDDKALRFDIEDDGGELRINADIVRCSGFKSGRYGTDRSGASLHLQTENFVKWLVKSCDSMASEQKASLLNNLLQARAEFPAALDELKARATRVFGGWQKRCIKYSTPKVQKIGKMRVIEVIDPLRVPDCVLYSDQAK